MTSHWYILIGVNFYYKGPKYARPTGPNGDYLKIKDLFGCVADVDLMEKYLLERQRVDPKQIYKLTSTHLDNSVDEGPKEENTDKLASRANILNTLIKVTRDANPGDVIHIHYSGHGDMVPTAYPTLKGPNAHDETLCPCDCITTTGDHILDVEVAYYMHEMVQKNLHITLIMDSCHSGGVRNIDDDKGDATARRVIGIDLTRREPPIPLDRIMATLGPTVENPGSQREISPKDSVTWLMEPLGFEIVAACRFDQLAAEDKVNTGDWQPKKHGLLTWNMYKTLEEAAARDTPLSHGELFRDLQLKMGDLPSQNPVFSGLGKRLLFDKRNIEELPSAHPVRNICRTRLTIGAGSVQGFVEGSELVLFPWNEREMTFVAGKTPRVRVIRAYNFFCLAMPIKDSPRITEDNATGAYKAMIRYSPFPRLKIMPTGELLQDTHVETLRALKEAVTTASGDGKNDQLVCPLILVDGEAKDPIDYHLGLNTRNEYELRSTNDVKIVGFPATNSLDELFTSLTHVAKFSMVRDLKPTKNYPLLQDKFEFTLVDRNGKIQVKDPDSGMYVLPEGAELVARFKNNSTIAVNICIMDFTPEWAVKQLFPAGADYEAVEKGGVKDKGIQVSIAKNQAHDEPVDILKVIVFRADTNLKSLEMSKLNDLHSDKRGASEDNVGSLWRLLRALGSPKREIIDPVEEIPDEQWATASIMIKAQPLTKDDDSDTSVA